MPETSKVTFGEARKTIASVVGLATTALAYVAADATLREIVPPEVVAVVGAVLTILGVFFVPNNKHVVTEEVQVPVEVPVPAPPMTPVDMINGAVEAAKGTAQGVANGIGQLQEIMGGLSGLVTLAPDMPGELDDLAKGWIAGLGKKP
jgi:Ni,Fe-hydrogenase III small subunit